MSADLDAFRDAVAVLRAGGDVAGYLGTWVERFWSPGHPFRMQERVFARVTWRSGESELMEDYPPWTFVPDLARGELTIDGGPHDQTYEVTWLAPDGQAALFPFYGRDPVRGVPDHLRTAYLNQLAQGLRPQTEGLTWFTGLEPSAQASVLQEISHHLTQAHPTETDVTPALERSGLRPGQTPAVLLSKGPTNDQIDKIATLHPTDERIKAYKLLIALLGIADDRRRSIQCARTCNHWWHQLGT